MGIPVFASASFIIKSKFVVYVACVSNINNDMLITYSMPKVLNPTTYQDAKKWGVML